MCGVILLVTESRPEKFRAGGALGSNRFDCSSLLMIFGHKQILSDEALMRLIKLRDPEARSILFDRYKRLVSKVTSRILNDVVEAEDLAQKIFNEIYRTASQFDGGKTSAKSWILRHTYSMSFERLKYLNLKASPGPLKPDAVAGEKNSSPRANNLKWDSTRRKSGANVTPFYSVWATRTGKKL